MNDHDMRGMIEYLAQFVTPEKWKKIERVAHGRTRYLTVVLEQINAPLNVSAALRTVEAFGIQDMYIVDSPEFKSELNSGIAKGAQEWLTINRYRDAKGSAIKKCITDLKKAGYAIVATMPHVTGKSPEEIDLSRKTALVFGNEEFGVSNMIQEAADSFLTVPMSGFTESFNVAATVAICVHSLITRLKASGIDWRLSEQEINILYCEWVKKSLRAGDDVEQRYLQKIKGQ